MKIEINDTVKFKLKPIAKQFESTEGEGIVKKKGALFYEVDCNGYLLLVKPSKIIKE
jgi:hypothetical protein